MTSVRMSGVEIEDVRTMKAFRTLLKFSPATSTSLEAVDVGLINLAMAREFKNLLLFCPEPTESLVLLINDDIGCDGWELLAKAVQLRPGFVEKVSCCHDFLREARKEDMRVIWEAVGDVELVINDDRNWNFKREEGEKCWRRLAQVIILVRLFSQISLATKSQTLYFKALHVSASSPDHML